MKHRLLPLSASYSKGHHQELWNFLSALKLKTRYCCREKKRPFWNNLLSRNLSLSLALWNYWIPLHTLTHTHMHMQYKHTHTRAHTHIQYTHAHTHIQYTCAHTHAHTVHTHAHTRTYSTHTRTYSTHTHTVHTDMYIYEYCMFTWSSSHYRLHSGLNYSSVRQIRSVFCSH